MPPGCIKQGDVCGFPLQCGRVEEGHKAGSRSSQAALSVAKDKVLIHQHRIQQVLSGKGHPRLVSEEMVSNVLVLIT